MFIKHLRVCLEATHDVFCRLDAVDAHNCLLTQRWKYSCCRASARLALHQATFLCNRDRNWISACLGTMTLPPDSPFLKINNSAIQQSACSFKEVPRITLCLEANDIIPYQATVYGLSDITG